MNSATGNRVQALPFEILLDQARIASKVEQLGNRISVDYLGKPLVLIGVLKGCLVFMADLIRHVKVPLEMEFVASASLKRGIKDGADIVFAGGAEPSLRDRHVLIVEGIVDTGRTASLLLDKIRKMEPASVEIVTLLDKPGSHRSPIDIKYKGFSIGNEFIIGFGMDNAQKYRNLPFIGRVVDDK